MSRKCQICGKRAVTGNSVSRRGLPKKTGGVGLKTTGISGRRFLPNLQSKRIIVNGKTRKILVCTKCLKGNKLPLVSRTAAVPNN